MAAAVDLGFVLIGENKRQNDLLEEAIEDLLKKYEKIGKNRLGTV